MSEIYGEAPTHYELMDAGGGMKLERWGEIITIRPELQAYFKAVKSIEWWLEQAHWQFMPEKEQSINGLWKQLKQGAPTEWMFDLDVCSVLLRIGNNKHLGLFPEQQTNWNFLAENLNDESRFLNLFAYTGAASLIAKTAGADVTHIESMRGTLDWAKNNMEVNALSDIRWLLEDAPKFVQRELKRGKQYDCIQLDPPAYGSGAKGERWKIEDLLPELLQNCFQLLTPGGTLILNTYSPKITVETIRPMVGSFVQAKNVELSELWMKTTTGKRLHFGVLLRVTK